MSYSKCNQYPQTAIKYLLTLALMWKVLSIAFTAYGINLTEYPPFSMFAVEQHPDVYLKFEDICRNAGTHVETHFITTSDGFINKMWRINDGGIKKRPAALLLHGLIDSGESWVANERNKS